ncbi:MAG TPA: hypothetical protein VK071_06480 [Tissierellales bacterium]|nr:hypothetical protein [Tissierellales bacterium]
MELNKLENLATDKVMSLAELREDELYKKMPDEEIKYYVEESINIGLETAKKLLSTYATIDLEKICEDKGIKVILDTDEYGFELIKLRGKYDGKKKIVLYNKSISRIEEKLKELELSNTFNYNQIKEIQLAHELFHCLENKEIGITSEKLEPLIVKHIGIVKREYPVVKTSDIAAHIFTKELLQLEFHPKLMDYYYLVGAGYINYEFLENLFLELKKFI